VIHRVDDEPVPNGLIGQERTANLFPAGRVGWIGGCADFFGPQPIHCAGPDLVSRVHREDDDVVVVKGTQNRFGRVERVRGGVHDASAHIIADVSDVVRREFNETGDCGWLAFANRPGHMSHGGPAIEQAI
jgi:hypothetical protein